MRVCVTHWNSGIVVILYLRGIVYNAKRGRQGAVLNIWSYEKRHLKSIVFLKIKLFIGFIQLQ